MIEHATHPPADWTALRDDIQRLRTHKAAIEAVVKDAKAAFEAEMKPHKAQIDELGQHEQALVTQLRDLALANHLAGAPKTWGGVQLRETPTLVIRDEEAALASLDDVTIRGKPVVKRAIDRPLALRFAQLQQELGQPLPDGLAIEPEWILALVGTADA